MELIQAAAVVALLDTVPLVPQGVMMEILVAQQARQAPAVAAVEEEVADMKRTSTAPALGSFMVAVEAGVSACLALAVMGLVAEEVFTVAVAVAEALAGPMAAAEVAVVAPQGHTVVQPEGVGIANTPTPTEMPPMVPSALSVSSGVLAEAIRQTPQTSN